MDKTCCPQYTIRCDATQIILSKSQKKVLKRMNKFLMNGESSGININEDVKVDITQKLPEIQNDDNIVSSLASSSHNEVKSVKGPDPAKPKCRKAKEIRREKKLKKMIEKTDDQEIKNEVVKKTVKNSEKTIEDLLDSSLNSDALHKLTLSLVAVSDTETFEKTFEKEFELYCKYQHVIHGDSIEDLTRKQFKRFLVGTLLSPSDLLTYCNGPSITIC